MRETDKIAEALFEKIRDRFEDVSLGDDKAKATQDPERARFFNFDYVVDDKNYGNITISLIDETSLKVYFSKNISHELQDEERDKWYGFLRELREFSKRNLLSFEPRDITRSTLKHRDLKQVSKADSTYDKDEVVSESRMYGTMNRSYEDFGPVRIKVAHAKPITDETRGARSRNIAAVFVENNQGERFRMPFESLIGTRAMARHISAGGTPSDEFGQHICEMVEELNKLRPFVHSMRHRTFEDATTKDMIESAFEYHGLLKNTLKKMKGKKGYNEYKESYSPPLNETDDFNEDELREKFVKKVFPDRLSQALPIVHKAYNMKKENTNMYSAQFENWANQVAESWDEEEGYAQEQGEDSINVDDLADLFADELPLGIDAMNAIGAVSGVINSNELETALTQASQENPEADAREIIMNWVYNNEPNVYQELMNEIGDVEPADQDLGESGTGDAPIDSMTRAELLDFLGASPEEVMNVSDEELRAAANEKSESLPEGDTYGASGMDEPVVDEGNEGDDSCEAIQSAVIRRIINQHKDLLVQHGPQAIMDAARDVAEFAGPVEEIGSSDVSGWVQRVIDQLEGTTEYNEALTKALGEGTYCDACDSTQCQCDDGNEEMDEAIGDDHVNKDVKMKRMGAKPLNFLDKLKTIPHGIKAMAKDEPEDDVSLYNKQFDEDIAQMRKIAGLK